ncbi:hypothetical protein PIB30_002447 [Stylosanthes scabra]|uniref:Uncharacterized protein n=1 Tax=Stylosanthes scabra TaxID=79078 RepID=A0ABU6W341_9FABA|nr:hypothetical protein [Stylosanthes scabra]
MYRLDRILHVVHKVDSETNRCIVSVRRQIVMDLHPPSWRTYSGPAYSRLHD